MTRGEIAQALFVFSTKGFAIVTVKITDNETQDVIWRTFNLYYKPAIYTSLENYIADYIDRVTMQDYTDYTISITPRFDPPDDEYQDEPEDNWHEIMDDGRSRYRTRVERSK